MNIKRIIIYKSTNTTVEFINYFFGKYFLNIIFEYKFWLYVQKYDNDIYPYSSFLTNKIYHELKNNFNINQNILKNSFSILKQRKI